MNKLLEESEGLIFRSAVTISETDILIGRSRPLIRHRRDEKPQAAINEVSPVSDYRSLPTCAALQSRRDRMDSLLPSLSGDPPCILIIDDDTALLTALADTLKIRLEPSSSRRRPTERMDWPVLNRVVTILSCAMCRCRNQRAVSVAPAEANRSALVRTLKQVFHA
jgi:hypothetical protein